MDDYQKARDEAAEAQSERITLSLIEADLRARHFKRGADWARKYCHTHPEEWVCKLCGDHNDGEAISSGWGGEVKFREFWIYDGEYPGQAFDGPSDNIHLPRIHVVEAEPVIKLIERLYLWAMDMRSS